MGRPGQISVNCNEYIYIYIFIYNIVIHWSAPKYLAEYGVCGILTLIYFCVATLNCRSVTTNVWLKIGLPEFLFTPWPSNRNEAVLDTILIKVPPKYQSQRSSPLMIPYRMLKAPSLSWHGGKCDVFILLIACLQSLCWLVQKDAQRQVEEIYF